MPDIVWSRPARSDLERINAFLSAEAAPDVAVRILTAILNRSKFLEDFTHAARPLPDGLRVLRVFDTPDLIRYRIHEGRVEVIRVHHERENWLVEP